MQYHYYTIEPESGEAVQDHKKSQESKQITSIMVGSVSG